MRASKQIAVLGGGVMGEALISGFLAGGKVSHKQVVVTDARPERLTTLSSRFGVGVTPSNTAAVTEADLVVVAVKPPVVPVVLEEIAPVLRGGAAVVSIAAGVTLAELEARLPGGVAVVRAMPNSPCRIRAGVVALAEGRGVTAETRALVGEIMEAVGRVIWLEEHLMDAVTGLSGSGPAYVYLFIEALAEGGVKAGLPRQVALELAVQTVLGAAQMVASTREHPAVLKDQVATPAGTTIAGLAVLEEAAFRGAVLRAVEAGARRSAELAGQRARQDDSGSKKKGTPA
ncbi:MAG: pyrroline-5-carboxylate reductase [Bacillota bacterium]|nr:pyrroline-5-carboxylate reductase [Bacillota bacterium]